VFSPTFSTFGNGFNNGFGSGFLGFGTNQGGLNNFLASPLSNGFNAITTNQNLLLGFNPSGTGFTGFGGSSLTTGTGSTGIGGTGGVV